MQINFIYDSSTASAPAAFKTALADAATYLDSLITNNITVNIQVGWGEDNGAPITPDSLSTGGPQQDGIGMTYAQLKAALTAHATSAAGSRNRPRSVPQRTRRPGCMRSSTSATK